MTNTDVIKKYKNFLIQIFLVGLIIFSGWFFLRPKIADIFQMRKKLNKERERLAKLTQKETFLESLDEYELTTKTRLLLKILPAEKDVILPWTTLRHLASQFNLRIKSIQVDLGDESRGKLSTIVFSLKVKGDKENIKKFIEKIKVTYPLMKIEELSVSLKTESELETALKIKTFFLPLPTEIGKIEEPLSLITPAEEKAYREVSIFSSPLKEEVIPAFPSGKENPFAL